MIAAQFTQDPAEPDRFWSVIRVTGTHTGEFNMGTAKVPPTGKTMVVGPQAYSVTFDANDKITRQTGGYIADVRDGATGDAGAMWAVARAHRRANAPRRRQDRRQDYGLVRSSRTSPRGALTPLTCPPLGLRAADCAPPTRGPSRPRAATNAKGTLLMRSFYFLLLLEAHAAFRECARRVVHLHFRIRLAR